MHITETCADAKLSIGLDVQIGIPTWPPCSASCLHLKQTDLDHMPCPPRQWWVPAIATFWCHEQKRSNRRKLAIGAPDKIPKVGKLQLVLHSRGVWNRNDLNEHAVGRQRPVYVPLLRNVREALISTSWHNFTSGPTNESGTEMAWSAHHGTTSHRVQRMNLELRWLGHPSHAKGTQWKARNHGNTENDCQPQVATHSQEGVPDTPGTLSRHCLLTRDTLQGAGDSPQQFPQEGTWRERERERERQRERGETEREREREIFWFSACHMGHCKKVSLHNFSSIANPPSGLWLH